MRLEHTIEVLINRTLVYGTLTAMLALIYFGGILGLQMLFHTVTGQTSQPELAIIGSTLAIVALFRPLRSRIQEGIDRRFYRQRYDAERSLAAFSDSLREELDLEQIRERLVAVVDKTMQPTFISLWLRQPERPHSTSSPLPPLGNAPRNASRNDYTT